MDDPAAHVSAKPNPWPSAVSHVGARGRATRSGAATDGSSEDDPLVVFAYASLRREVASLREHAPAPGAVPEPEHVHRLRIAARRLRTALRLFRRVLPTKRAAALRKELRWFGRALSEVRDLDVYTESFRNYLQTLSPEQLEGMSDYELHVRRARVETRGELGALFTGKRYRALLKSLAKFLDGAPSSRALRRWCSFRVSDAFDKYLRKSAKRVQKLGRKIDDKARSKKLHKLRIRVKRFRYELEFFTAIYPSLDAAAKAAKGLQDVLGAHQDARTARARLERYMPSLEARDDDTPIALQHLLDAERCRAQEARRAFPTEWRRFTRSLESSKLEA